MGLMFKIMNEWFISSGGIKLTKELSYEFCSFRPLTFPFYYCKVLSYAYV